MNNNRIYNIKSIQILRSIAALSVVYAHYSNYAFPQFATGAYGVDIFFIISGFIIAYIVSGNKEHFLIKRIIRVVPLYVIATGISILVSLCSPHWVNNTSISITAVVKSLLFIPYKVNNSGPILSLGWSLNYEMFFYFTMFICIVLVRNKKYLSIACSLFLIILTILLNFLHTDNFIIHFYQKGLFPEFIFGIVLFHFYPYFSVRNKSSSSATGINIFYTTLLSLIAVFSIVFLSLSCIYHWHISSNSNIQVGIPALILVTAFLALENKINGNNILVKLSLLLGDASYVMYLFHPFCIFFLQRIIFPALGIQHNGLIVELLKLFISLSLTAIASVYLYKFMDNPIQIYLRKILLNKKRNK